MNYNQEIVWNTYLSFEISKNWYAGGSKLQFYIISQNIEETKIFKSMITSYWGNLIVFVYKSNNMCFTGLFSSTFLLFWRLRIKIKSNDTAVSGGTFIYPVKKLFVGLYFMEGLKWQWFWNRFPFPLNSNKNLSLYYNGNFCLFYFKTIFIKYTWTK